MDHVPPNVGTEYLGGDDMMKILVATDNHIGYMEKDPVRFNDSLEAFEEILEIARSQNADFILLGGDLYHDNKPSRQTLHSTMELLRHYCMGSRPCPIEFRSDPEVNFHSRFKTVNYEDPNYNVSIPVFSIHGNHDDPVGEGELSAMDILDVSNLVNYFGKVKDVQKIELSPLLLQKGDTKLALYGLGSCRDERLHRTFRRGNVKFLRPNEEESVWFNILVLHQNRAKHGSTNYIPASFIPDFFDLVIWGHEHECRLEPEFTPTGGVADDGEDKGLFISQPGSSIATSFSDGEQRPKHCGILYIKNDCSFKLEPVKLKSVRPFIIDSVCLSDTGIHPQDEDKVEEYLKKKVSDLIEEACKESENEKLPLVRLKVDYHGGYSVFSLARFGQQFLEKVANPKNILQWHCRREKPDKKAAEEDVVLPEDRTQNTADISEFLDEEVARQRIELLSNKNMSEAIHEFVDKMESDSVSVCVEFSLKASQQHLLSKKLKENEIEDYMDKKKECIFEVQESQGMPAIRQALAKRRAEKPDDDFGGADDSDSDGATAAPEPVRGRGRGRGSRARGRASTTSRRGQRGRGRGSKSISQSPVATPQLEIIGGGASVSATRGRAKRTRQQDTADASGSKRKKQGLDFVDLTEEDDDEDFQAPSISRSKPATSKRRKY